MTLAEAIRKVVKEYVSEHGRDHVVTRQQLSNMVMEAFPHNPNSFLPADYCYNRTNKGISFEEHVHLFEYMNDGNYRILGEGYPYTGEVFYREKGESSDSVYGSWTAGVFHVGENVSSEMLLKAKCLADELNTRFSTKQSVIAGRLVVSAKKGNDVLCDITIWEEAYKLSTKLPGWKDITSYKGTETGDGAFEYFADTMEETIAEVERMDNHKSSMNAALYDYLTQSYQMDLPESWKGDVRPAFQKLFDSLIKDTDFYFEVNTTDTKSKILELRQNGIKKRLMGFAGKQNMEIRAFFNAEFYNQIRQTVALPDNQLPNKTQPHVDISLQTLWNVLCVATGNHQYMKK